MTTATDALAGPGSNARPVICTSATLILSRRHGGVTLDTTSNNHNQHEIQENEHATRATNGQLGPELLPGPVKNAEAAKSIVTFHPVFMRESGLDKEPAAKCEYFLETIANAAPTARWCQLLTRATGSVGGAETSPFMVSPFEMAWNAE